MEHHDLLAGFIRLHVLHHAAQHEIYGQWMIDELARHGYRLSPGTLYPMLHAMEQRGYLVSRVERSGRSRRTLHRATKFGLQGLTLARERIRELSGPVQQATPAQGTPGSEPPDDQQNATRKSG
jgi:PadR family transcriptional regulator, regulatory protein PadR